MKEPLLIVFGGLPGVGKTTLAKALSSKIVASYIRIDTIEQTLMRQNSLMSGTEGYLVAYDLAEENLMIGNNVIADSVNSIEETRRAWHETALKSSSQILEIEVICSDKIEHKKRVESRTADINGHKLPTWEEILNREYQPWGTKNITIDTCIGNTEDHLNLILKQISQQQKDLKNDN